MEGAGCETGVGAGAGADVSFTSVAVTVGTTSRISGFGGGAGALSSAISGTSELLFTEAATLGEAGSGVLEASPI